MGYRISKVYLKNITEALKEHKAIVDQIAKTYAAEKKAFEDELNSMKGKYTDTYIEETRKGYKPKVNYQDALISRQKRTTDTVENCANQIHESIERFFNAPVSTAFANKISAISLSGVALSDREFELLAKTCSSYMEARILSSLSESRERKTIVQTDNNGILEKEKVATPDAYHLSNMVEFEKIEEELENYLVQVKRFIDGYCGPNIELYEFRTCNNKNLGYDKAMASTHSNFLENGHDAELLNFIDSVNKLSNGIESTPLSADEKNLIDEIIDPQYQTLIPGDVKRVSESNALLRDMLLRDERYSKFVPSEEL